MIGEGIFVRSVKGGPVMQSQKRRELPPPCRTCYQVKDPVACENKECKRWRAWFVTQWDKSRQRLLQTVEVQPQRV